MAKKRGGCALIGNKKHPGANSAKLRPQVENFGSVFAKSRRVEDQVSLRLKLHLILGCQDVGTCGGAGGLPRLDRVPVRLLWRGVQDEREAEATPVLKSWFRQAGGSVGWRNLNQHYFLTKRDLMEV